MGALLGHCLQMVLNQIALVYFVVYALVMLPIYRGTMRALSSTRSAISHGHGEKQEVRRVLGPLASVGQAVRSTLARFHPHRRQVLRMGDNMSGDADWPSYRILLLRQPGHDAVHEFGFYWCYRLAHHPKLDKYHKVHHEYHQNMVLAAQHEHPIDYIVTIATPALLAVSGRAQSFTLFQWIAWLVMANIDDHVGYEFPWSPVRWFPFAAATDMHEFHHSKNMGCFASKLNINDRIFNSEQPYLRWRAARDAKAGIKAE